MRLIISLNGNGLTINFENISKILNEGDYITLIGLYITIAVNATDICSLSTVTIPKRWLLTADEVYFDTRIEEVTDG